MTGKPSPDAEVEIVLNYINILYATMCKHWTTSSRFLLFTSILSSLLIALSVEVVTPGETITILGLELDTGITVLFVIGSASLYPLSLGVISHNNHAYALKNEIIRHYGAIGFTDYAMDTKDRSPLYPPDLFEAAEALFDRESGSFWRNAGLVVWFILQVMAVVLLPVSAQISCGWRLSELFGLWIWLPFSVLIVATFFTIFKPLWTLSNHD